MKKLIFILMLCLAMPAAAQKVYRNVELKSFRMGTMKLYMTDSLTYAINFSTGNTFKPTFVCILGDRENAIKLLTFLRDLKLGDDDVVDLENASENYVTKGMWTALRIHSSGKQFSYDVTPKEIRKMLEAIEKQE